VVAIGEVEELREESRECGNLSRSQKGGIEIQVARMQHCLEQLSHTLEAVISREQTRDYRSRPEEGGHQAQSGAEAQSGAQAAQTELREPGPPIESRDRLQGAQGVVGATGGAA